MSDTSDTSITDTADTADEPDATAVEAGRKLFARECRFVAGAATTDIIPEPDRGEIAFAGRSNVGKSSLVNALTGRKTLARISQTPGRTQQINFFLLDDKFYLVDLPGYGYARASKEKIRAWTEVVNRYLRGRPTLRRLYLLIDARHGPKPPDRDLMDMLDKAAVSYQVVLTKSDKARSAELARAMTATAAELSRRPAAHPLIIATSARSGDGVAELRARIAILAEQTGMG
jgi:GTP-binding protein